MSFMTERLFQLLESHKVYDKIHDSKTISAFMEYHIICVWAYDALLKSLQKDLLGHATPLLSDEQKEAIHLICEIALEEQVEALPDGGFQSHMELYLDNMVDENCDTTPTLEFFRNLEHSVPIPRALRRSGFDKAVVDYGLGIMKILESEPHKKAAALFYEGEPFIPDAFLIRLNELSEIQAAEGLIDYFERHIEGLKRPGYSSAGRLVEIFCETNSTNHEECEAVAQQLMRQRIELWDRLADKLEELQPQNSPLRENALPNLRLICNMQSSS